MTFMLELLTDSHTWWRIADPVWENPLDPRYAMHSGGRWNPPNSFPVLYLNEDQVTGRLNLRAFIAKWPYEPEDLRSDTGPVLIGVELPRQQQVVDVHSRAGVLAVGLPFTYPLDRRRKRVSHARCQPIGVSAKAAGIRGIRARSAQSPDGAGRELAWFPANERSVARRTSTMGFEDWYWC
jgi:RES domain